MPPDVAGAQPTVGRDRLRGRLRPAPVAGHHHRAAHAHLALVAFRHRAAHRVADLELDGRQRAADRHREVDELLAVVQRGERGALGLPVADADAVARVREDAPRPFDQRRRDRRTTAADGLDRSTGRTSPTSGWFTMRCNTVSVNDQPVHRSRSITCIATAGSKRPISHTLFSPVASIITAALCRPETWNSGLDTSWHVGQRRRVVGTGRRREHHRLGAVVEVEHQVRRDVAVRVDRALGPAGRARRVEDDRGIVLVDLDVGERRVGRVRLELGEVVLHHDDGNAGIGAFDALDALAVGDEHLRVRSRRGSSGSRARSTSRSGRPRSRPRLIAAQNEITHSGQFAPRIATRSPGCTS